MRRHNLPVRLCMSVAMGLAFLFAPLTAKARQTLPHLSLSVDGYYWARYTYIRDLANLKNQVLPGTGNRLRNPILNTNYMTHQVRVEPRVRLGRLAKVQMRIDALQDVVWGDNAGLAPIGLFSEQPSDTDAMGNQVSSIALHSVFLELNVNIGLLRIGRMPANWGMGYLINDGGNLTKHRAGVDDSFGDNHFPTIYDRAMFLTDVIKLVRRFSRFKIATNHHLYLAYAYDRIVEEPNVPGLPSDFQRPYGEQTFLSREQNNVDEHVGILLYQWNHFADSVPWLKRWGPTALKAGLYVAYRRQRTTAGIVRLWDSATNGYVAHDCTTEDLPICGGKNDIMTLDPYFNIHLGRLVTAGAEAYFVRGQTDRRAIAIGPGVTRVAAYGWVTRVQSSVLRWLGMSAEAGQAAGDANFSDRTFRQVSAHPDYNVGLILYEEFLRQRSATALAYAYPYRQDPTKVWASRGLQSNGGVIDSFYFMPMVSASPVEFLKVRLAVLTAWAHRQDGALFPTGRGRRIGTEVDLGLDVKWGLGDDELSHLLLRVETGYLFFGPQVAPDYAAPGSFSIQARVAFVL